MAGDRRNSTTVVVDRRHRLRATRGKEGGFRPPGYDDAIVGEQRHFTAEELRLLVAATRAKTGSSFRSSPKDRGRRPRAKCLADRLRRRRTSHGDLDALALPGRARSGAARSTQPRVPNIAVRAVRRAWIDT
jgi:hypothetical protein